MRMSTFSANTRVELTAEGWWFLAAQNAKAAARTKDSAAASKLRAIAKDQASRAADALVTEKGKNLPEGSGTR
jgi:hypothetical protein